MHIKGFSRYTIQKNGVILNDFNVPIKYFKSNKYLQCYMVDDEGVSHVFGVHTVIAREHCPEWLPGCVVHHRDGNCHNNNVDNLECMSRSKHSAQHANPAAIIYRAKTVGPANKGKSMSEEFCKKCSESAKRRGFVGNQYVDKYGHRRQSTRS